MSLFSRLFLILTLLFTIFGAASFVEAQSTAWNLPPEIPALWVGWDLMPENDQIVTNNGGKDISINCSGIQGSPAGVTASEIISANNEKFVISGNDCVIHDLHLEGYTVTVSGERMVFRDSEIDGKSITSRNGYNGTADYQVVLNNHIHHHQGDDKHGMWVGGDNVWMGFNEVHHNGGDGFQAGHRKSEDRPTNIYLFNNLFYSDRENSLDFKYLQNVWAVENEMHSLVSARADESWCFDDGTKCGVFSSGSDGSAVVVGSDGGPIDVHLIRNTIYDTNRGIRIEEAYGDIELIENNLYSINNSCLQLDKDGMDILFKGNTCKDSGRGIFQNWRVNFSLNVLNNIFENISGPAIEYETGSVAGASTLMGNAFNSTGPVIYNKTVASTEIEINALSSANLNVVNGTAPTYSAPEIIASVPESTPVVEQTQSKTPTPISKNRIQVNTGDGSRLNVRSLAGGTLLGKQFDGAFGVATGDTTFVNGLTWWKVNFDTGASGWVAKDFITVFSSSASGSTTEVLLVQLTILLELVASLEAQLSKLQGN